MDSLPHWLLWAEVAFAAPACVICCSLFIALVVIPLPSMCKSFLFLNTAALFSLSLCQALIAVWESENNRGIELDELSFFPLIFTHQFFYYMSTVSLLFLTCERLLLSYYPSFYENHKWRIVPSFCVATLLELILIIPLTVLNQYGGIQHAVTMITTLTDLTTLLLLLLCYRQSQSYYATSFANGDLNTRYQLKEVIELTRVLIPIGITSLVLKLTIEILGTFVFIDAEHISTFVLVLRIVCTTMAYVEPILLILRHRWISRRILQLLKPGRVGPHLETKYITAQDTTQSYFDALRRDWG